MLEIDNIIFLEKPVKFSTDENSASVMARAFCNLIHQQNGTCKVFSAISL